MSKRILTAESRRAEPIVIFRIGTQRFVLSSAEIEEIRDLHSGAVPATVTTRRNAKISVVLADRVFGLHSTVREQLLILKRHAVAVAIDRIEGMSELREIVALPHGFHGTEQSWYRGLALVSGHILPVVNSAIFAKFWPASAPETTPALSIGRANLR